jgi:hypothetical protein
MGWQCMIDRSSKYLRGGSLWSRGIGEYCRVEDTLHGWNRLGIGRVCESMEHVVPPSKQGDTLVSSGDTSVKKQTQVAKYPADY